MRDNAIVLFVILVSSICFFSGCTNSTEKDITDNEGSKAENASVVARAENNRIKITLTTGGDNIPGSGYLFESNVTIRLNGTILDKSALAGNIGWEVGESLYIGNSDPVLDDKSYIGTLGEGNYTITVIILDTVVYDGLIKIV